MPGKAIGPRMSNGKFYSQRKNVAKSTLRKNAKVAKSLTKTQKKAVKQIVNRAEETKYYSELLLNGNSLDWAIHTPYTGSGAADILPLVPRIKPGDGSFQRSGAKVKPTSCKVDISVALNEDIYGNSPETPDQKWYSRDLFVVMYIVKPKSFKNFNQFANSGTTAGSPPITTGAEWLNLLDNGDGTTKPFGFGTTIGGNYYYYSQANDLMAPVNKEHYTVLQKKVVRLQKNYGQTNTDGSPSDYPNISKSSWIGSMKVKLPTLLYDDMSPPNQTAGYPTNSCVCLMIGSVLANNLPSLGYTQGQPSVVLDNPITATVRTHYYYKDA